MISGDRATGTRTLSGDGVGNSPPVCPECGQHELHEDSPHEFADGLIDRLICQSCGAHRLT